MPAKKIADFPGDKAEYLLNYQCKTISKDQLHLPGADFVDRIRINSDRNPIFQGKEFHPTHLPKNL